MVHPFAVRQSLRDPKHRRFLSENKHFYSKLNELASMAQAMQYLTEHSVGMFHTRLLEYEGSKNVEKGGKVAASKKKTMMSDANADYRKIKVLLEKLTIRDGRFSHPKMWYLRDAVTAHFAGEREQGRETRVMVFCSWRECVTEIVDYLNDQDGTDIRATQFIGQSADRQGRKGFKQSDQELVSAGMRRAPVRRSPMLLPGHSPVQEGLLQRHRRDVDRRGGPGHWRDRPDRVLRGCQGLRPHGEQAASRVGLPADAPRPPAAARRPHGTQARRQDHRAHVRGPRREALAAVEGQLQGRAAGHHHGPASRAL
jgi:hypothetical protein